MDLSTARIEAEHHFVVESASGNFDLEVGQLRPFLVTQGKWLLQPQHFSATKALETEGNFTGGIKIISENVTSGNEQLLTLVSFNQSQFEKKERSLIFENTRPQVITHASDRLSFRLQTLAGDPVKVPADGKVLFGLALIQVR